MICPKSDQYVANENKDAPISDKEKGVVCLLIGARQCHTYMYKLFKVYVALTLNSPENDKKNFFITR